MKHHQKKESMVVAGREIKNGPGIGAVLLGIMMALAGSFSRAAAQNKAADTALKDFLPVLQDTLYVLDSMYIEVNIGVQEVYQHYSNGIIDTFLCSTGNPKLPQGIATRPGIFTIKAKAKKHISSAFNVPMYYWMPFDGGIGFHSLTGTGYYMHLGYEPSSHGCVRMSNESAEDLFNNTPVGTVVYVHGGMPARVLKFAAESMSDLRVIKPSDRSLLRKRLDAVMKGRRDAPALREKLGVPRKFGANIGVGEITVIER